MKVYTVCARAQASIFMVFWPFSSKKLPNCWRNLNDERWSTEWSKVKILEDNQGVHGRFFHKMCEKYYRKSCKYTCNNSKKQKGKKKIQLHIIDQSFEHNGMDISYQKRLESLDLKKAVHTSCKHSQKDLPTLYQRRTGRQTHVMWTP